MRRARFFDSPGNRYEKAYHAFIHSKFTAQILAGIHPFPPKPEASRIAFVLPVSLLTPYGVHRKNRHRNERGSRQDRGETTLPGR